MILKQIPEDFIVKELSGYEKEEGLYAIFILKKTNYTTEKAIQTVCNSLHIERKRAGYAGIKDKNAITSQYISIYKIKKEKVESLELKDIKFRFVSYSKKPISLGDLEGNTFEIIVRDLDKDAEINSYKKIKNFFDEQRFSENNVEIGKAILKKNFKKAVELILEGKGDYEKRVKAFIDSNPNNYISALRKIPKKILLLFVHSFQSYVFNKTIKDIDNEENIKIPLVGFGTEYGSNDIKRIIKSILVSNGITERDFIVNSIPELSCEGDERHLYIEPKNLKVEKLEIDELNKGRYKVKISFSLPKGAYATNLVKQIISP
ncbi:tRNA pseudouridine(13) synthase TruD [Candidatus Woesearchaeota archaeon]|nr:tRNA pseudouridine(13) synthase TruD [Candidatus Woesearchaeota archaeon]